MDPGCDFKEQPESEPCGVTPTELLALGMTAPDPAKGAGHAGDFMYGHFCKDHLLVMQERMGQG